MLGECGTIRVGDPMQGLHFCEDARVNGGGVEPPPHTERCERGTNGSALAESVRALEGGVGRVCQSGVGEDNLSVPFLG